MSVAPINPIAAFIATARAALDALDQLPRQSLQHGDEVRPLSALAAEWGIEAKALTREAKRAKIAVRIGRQLCVKRSAALALVDRLQAEQAQRAPRTVEATPDDAYASLVEVTKRRRGRRAA